MTKRLHLRKQQAPRMPVQLTTADKGSVIDILVPAFDGPAFWTPLRIAALVPFAVLAIVPKKAARRVLFGWRVQAALAVVAGGFCVFGFSVQFWAEDRSDAGWQYRAEVGDIIAEATESSTAALLDGLILSGDDWDSHVLLFDKDGCRICAVSAVSKGDNVALTLDCPEGEESSSAFLPDPA